MPGGEKGRRPPRRVVELDTIYRDQKAAIDFLKAAPDRRGAPLARSLMLLGYQLLLSSAQQRTAENGDGKAEEGNSGD